MSKNEFTPGPWVWHDRGPGEWDHLDEGFIKAGDVLVCDFGNNETYYNTAGTKPEPADIALICAAPELLEALEAAVDDATGNPNTWFFKAKDAIAKARGET